MAAHAWINWLLTPSTAVTEMNYHNYKIPIASALDQLPGHDAVRATYGGKPGHPVVFSRAVMDAVGELTGDTGARDLLARFRVAKWEAGHLCSAADVAPGTAIKVEQAGLALAVYNVDGEFFVDSTCIDCDACRQIAPAVFHDIGDQSAVANSSSISSA